ncbi:hypothetical protein HDU93_006352, partial [Gonapodya sp. JEL0774]
IPPEKAAETRAHLDFREKNGYASVLVPVYGLIPSTASTSPPTETVLVENAVLYIGLPSNPSFLGPAPISEMAYHIVTSHGPSGPNIDYLEGMVKYMGSNGLRDRHVEKLWGAVQALRKVVRARRLATEKMEKDLEKQEENGVIDKHPHATSVSSPTTNSEGSFTTEDDPRFPAWEARHRELGKRVKQAWRELGYLATGVPITKEDIAGANGVDTKDLIDGNADITKVASALFSERKMAYG